MLPNITDKGKTDHSLYSKYLNATNDQRQRHGLRVLDDLYHKLKTKLDIFVSLFGLSTVREAYGISLLFNLF